MFGSLGILFLIFILGLNCVGPVNGDWPGRQNENNNKPMFINCQDFSRQAAVDEESPKGSQVIQFRARDRDADGDPDSPAGKIVYSIASTHKHFKIHPDTGWLSTNKVFNRDEPEREKLVHVTVKAVDQGKPPLEDVCTIAVKIRDINDNPPIFDRANYDVPIAQETELDKMILRVLATDVDEGRNQDISYSLEATRFPQDLDYFRWDERTGEIRLKKKLDKPESSVFQLKAIARDNGSPLSKETRIDVTIEVKDSSNKPPVFRQGPGAEISLSEGSEDFENVVATYTADSQIPGDPQVYFELINGQSEQTNKEATFRGVVNRDNQNQYDIYQAKKLEYEWINEYTLTILVRNNADLVAEAQLAIKVHDENNQAPVFIAIKSGSVLENVPPGSTVMQVSAIDSDGTYPNNRVRYKLGTASKKDRENLNKFQINEDTGAITTKVEFDREETEYYALSVIAEDGAPSSLLKNNGHNQTPQRFRIIIKDKNDNPPYFSQHAYSAEVPEDADKGSKVIEVHADDLDTEASLTTYSIKAGNLGLAFRIEPLTGFIRVNKPLDYENINEYTLVVAVKDGKYANDTTVHIKVLNRNDMKPEFVMKEYRTRLKEEEVPSYPILQVTAYDPDIKDRNAPQNITYFLDQTDEISSFFAIDPQIGALRIIKPLDRDRPNGYPVWNMKVYAKDSFIDENGERSQPLENFVEVKITLDDINDNAPFLDMPDGLVWYENQQPGKVEILKADDYDTVENGPPYRFELDRDAPADIKDKFDVLNGGSDVYYLVTKTTFDREEQKEYQIPIRIEDNKGMAATSELRLVIGDENDNPMAPGASSIFVYNYEGRAPNTEIGRVYVTDPDDWDIPDKTFEFKNSHNGFSLNPNSGMITMLSGIRLEQEVNTFFLEFLVADPTHQQTGRAAVPANVTVKVKKLPKEAVDQSGSIRLDVKVERFISERGREKLTELLRAYLNATHVDVFTILPSNNGLTTDLRFSAHELLYLSPEKMEMSVARMKDDLERQLGEKGMKILMIHLDECLHEGTNCEGSCYNQLETSPRHTLVMTNTTSFVGVTARVIPHCSCSTVPYSRRPCSTNPCINGGQCLRSSNSYHGYHCKCPATGHQYGPHCEKTEATFRRGWALYPGLQSCENTSISFIFRSSDSKDNGLLLYQGPSPNTVVENVTDFFALEMKGGRLNYYLSFGSEVWQGELEKNVADGKEHKVKIRWSNQSVSMTIDGGVCKQFSHCTLQADRPRGRSQFMNSNGPLQVGGLYFGHHRIADLAKGLGKPVEQLPYGVGFAGCMKNLTVVQGKKETWYSLGNPAAFSDPKTFKGGWDLEFASVLDMNVNLLIGILVTLAVIILIGVITMAVMRKRRGSPPMTWTSTVTDTERLDCREMN